MSEKDNDKELSIGDLVVRYWAIVLGVVFWVFVAIVLLSNKG